MLFIKFFANCDAPENWQLNLQDPATPAVEGMAFFHDYLNSYMIIIGAVVFFLLIKTYSLFNSETYRKKNFMKINTYYRFLRIKLQNLKERCLGCTVFLLRKLIDTYKTYKYAIYFVMLICGIGSSNFKLCFFIVINVTIDFIYNHSLFKEIRKQIDQDVTTYNTHWLEDRDLRFIVVLLRFLFLTGLLIFIFSFTPPMFFGPHVLKLFPFTFGGYDFNLGTVQFILAVHLVGPKILLVVFVLKLLCDVHIIYFRNTKTHFKSIAFGGKFKLFFLTCGALYCTIEGVEKVTIILERWHQQYHSNEFPSNYFKATVQKTFHGVIRLNDKQELAYDLIKSRNLNLNVRDLRNPFTFVLDLERFNHQLSLEQNKKELLKLTSLDLKMLNFISLGNEEDVLRHNLATIFGIARKEATVENLICFFSKQDLENFMVSGKECPTDLELQIFLKNLIKSISTTEDGRTVLQRFINKKSNALFAILQDLKSVDNDLKQIAMERAFKEAIIIEDTSSLWLEQHKKSNPVSTFLGLTNESKLLKEYEVIIRRTIIALLPKTPS